jgi:hypothetical protein
MASSLEMLDDRHHAGAGKTATSVASRAGWTGLCSAGIVA